MDTPPTAKNWRLNAAAIIMDAEGCVLLGKDSGRNPYWHFPQGGVIKHESIEQTLAREVWEEVGLRPTEYTIVSRLPGLRYKYPSGNRKVTRWIGQEQTYFLVRCKTRRPKTDLHRSPEFSKTKWIPLQNLKLEFDKLREELQELQKKLFAQHKHKILVILQAMDAGGKDGCVKHVFSRVDPQGLHVVPFKKPTTEELDHDFLWRVHKEVPAKGQIAIFNRSHYEDIIAVRVKKIFPDPVWKRRYKHVLDFESMLAEEGTVIIKLFLNISKEEQKKRLESRLQDPDKLWKFCMDDLDDRNRWDEFQTAYQDLIEKTSTPEAPWYIIPADRKWYRNLVVARLMVEKLRHLQLSLPTPNFDPASIIIPD